MRKLSKMLGILLLAAMPICASAQNVTVKGIVKDAAGLPVIGAGVVQQGTSNGTVTDIDGKYSIAVPASSSLKFSSVGYVEQIIAVAGKNEINVVLAEDAEMLEETVVIGYGVQKKSDLTGSISSVNEDVFQNRSVNNVANAVSGKISGVQVISSSADPGSVGTIRIRGISSNSSSSSEPLYIVDGLQVSSLSAVEPQNVESMEILKDGASAAIYGAQAGNGVVVITTKSGKKGDGRVFYDGSYTIEKLGYHPTMMNATQYVDFVTNGGLITPATIEANWDGKQDTDWFKEFFPGGYSTRHTVGFEGGNDKGSFFTSITFLDNDGIVYGDRDRLQRLNFQLNASYNIKKWIKVGTTNTFQIRTSHGTMSSMGGSKTRSGADGSVMAMVYAMEPLTPMTYSPNNLTAYMKKLQEDGYRLLTVPNGDYISISEISGRSVNPLVDLYSDTENESKSVDLKGTLYLNLTPFKGFTFTSRLGYQFGAGNSHTFVEPWYHSSEANATQYKFSESVNWSLKYQWENFANYNITIAKNHNIDAMAGMSYIQNNSVSISGDTDELKSYAPNFRYLSYSTADANDNVSGTRNVSTSLSYFARLGYNYSNRYYIQASFRADAFDSSKLSKSARWGYFPSVSAGWTVTNEPFMQNVDKSILSFLKIRASWGINGNVGVLSGYKYASTVTVGGNQYNLGTDETLTLASYPSGLANDDLKWETSNQIDLGLDARFLSNRLTATFDYYDKRTNDLLVSVTPSYTTGQSSVYMNAGSVRNNGIEFELSWKDTIGDFSYGVSANISHNNNMVTYLNPTITRISGASVNNGHKATYFEVGYPVWYMSGYVHDGIDPETGDNKYKDLDGDGKVTSSDIQMIGNAQPDFTYGITLNAEYKGFDFTVFGSGSQGNDIWFAALCAHPTGRNYPTVFYDKAWKQPGDIAEYPRFGQALTTNYARSSACVYDGSYFRINQIQLGYTLPQSVLKAIKFKNIRVYASLDDFFTFSKYIGFDPVTASSDSGSGRGIDRGAYPSPKKAMFGINVSF